MSLASQIRRTTIDQDNRRASGDFIQYAKAAAVRGLGLAGCARGGKIKSRDRYCADRSARCSRSGNDNRCGMGLGTRAVSIDQQRLPRIIATQISISSNLIGWRVSCCPIPLAVRRRDGGPQPHG